MSYTSGYKKPPSHSQFKKGQSGNPAGRPKGARNVSSLLEKILFSPFKYTEGGKQKSSTRIDFLLKRLVNDAMKGDHKAVQILFVALRNGGGFEGAADKSLAVTDHEQILRTYFANMMADGVIDDTAVDASQEGA
jgi:hypothetical protein